MYHFEQVEVGTIQRVMQMSRQHAVARDPTSFATGTPSKPFNTPWVCACCSMLLCQIDCSDRIMRMYSCVLEHNMTHNKFIGCVFVAWITFKMPDELKIYKLARSKKKKSERD